MSSQGPSNATSVMVSPAEFSLIENKAAVASVRVLVPCLLLVIAVILAVFGPAIVRVIRGGLF